MTMYPGCRAVKFEGLNKLTFIFNILNLSLWSCVINIKHVKVTVTFYRVNFTEVISEEYTHACVLVSAATVYFDYVYVVD